MKKAILLSLFFIPFFCFATVWPVGPGKTYTLPSQVAALVSDGDTVDIDAGTYIGDVCVWNNSNLLLRGAGGRAHLRANGNYAQGKGIWVFAGNNTRVENMEFSEATVPDANGAGIRLDGLGVQVKNCYFHHNQNGILTGNNGGNIYIDNSEFAYNGYGDGFTHNIYIGHADTAVIRFSYFHHAIVGHELKSRASVNYILYNRISNEATGNASREIDLPNGGMSFIIGNIIQQGAASLNGNVIGYGLEGLVNTAPHEMYLVNNTLVNDRFTGSFIAAAAGTSLLKVYNNIFAGPATILNFSGAPASVDSLRNKVVTVAGAGFVNAAAYDYHLGTGSVAISAAGSAGLASNGFSLLPLFEYIHLASSISRTIEGSLDAGAYEYNTVVALSLVNFSAAKAEGQTIVRWQATDETGTKQYELQRSADGIGFETISLVLPKHLNSSLYEYKDAAVTGWSFYRLKITETNGSFYYSKTISLRQDIAGPAMQAFVSGTKLQLSHISAAFKNKSAEIQISNASGQLLGRKKIMFTGAGSIGVELNLPAHHEKYLLVTVYAAGQRVSIPVISLN